MSEPKDFGILLPEQTDGTCPNCRSVRVVVKNVCRGCGYENKQCKECGATWQEFLKEA